MIKMIKISHMVVVPMSVISAAFRRLRQEEC
jgi:hypothetical protein